MNIIITQKVKYQFLLKIYYLIFLLLISCVLMSLILTNSFYQKSVSADNLSVKVSDQNLKEYFIFDLESEKFNKQSKLINDIQIDQIRETKIIPNLTVVKLPKDLQNIKSIKNRKELFIKITLPLIVQENEKLQILNKTLKLIKSRYNQVSREEAIWVQNLMKEYNADNIDILLLKIDQIPVSLALAQAAIESGWGTSRFAYEGNALFGQYVWGKSKNGIVPNERETHANYKIKSFNSLSESVASYMKNLNTNSHYNEFRMNRSALRLKELPLSGSHLADFLFNYSIETDYPSKIKKIIEINNFEDFENLSIDNQLTIMTNII